jgi:glycosyltransferase involved in cell wall biosynthesis
METVIVSSDRDSAVPRAPPPVDVLVATYGSARTVRRTLDSVRRWVPVHCLIVVDRPSRDGTVEIAHEFGARVLDDDVGLGSARNRALREADTDPVLFVDSDVEIVRPDFYAEAAALFARPGTAAVVGNAVGHPFRYGLPLGLTLIGRRWSLDAGIPDRAQGRETYYLQRKVRRDRRRVRYVADAMVHAGTYRRDPNWPEFQGASIRSSSGWDPREVAYAGVVVLLMHANSRRVGNVLYSPVFYGKLLRGYLDPDRWGRLDRSGSVAVTPPGPGVGPHP